MKKLTLLKALFLLCALIVGTSTSWADETYNLTPDGTSTGSSSTSYITTLTEFTYEGIKWKMNQWNPSTLQIKTNKDNATSEFRFYNTTAFEGRIKQVVISFEALTLKDTDNPGFMFVGGTSEVTATTGGTQGTWNSTDKTLTWTPGASDNYTYFALYQNGKVATGTNKLATSDAIVVTYESSGSTATTTTITSTGITNTDLKNGTAAGSLSASVTVTEGGAAVSGATVTWKSSNENAAKIDNDGIVTLVGAGTTTITASYAGDNTYDASTDTYELTVTDTRTATVTTIDDAGITNTDLKNGIAAGTLTASVTAGGDPVLGATVTWKSSDPTVATITDGGVVTLVKVGTTTITASYAGGGSFAASSDTYELTVTDSRQPVTVEIDFNHEFFGKKITTWSSADPTSITKEKNNISVTYAKNDSKYYYISAEIRMYSELNSGGSKANTLTIEAPENYLISSIELTTSGGTWGTLASTPTGFDNTDKEWTSETPASSVVLEATSGTCRISKATVTLVPKLVVAYADGWMSYVTPCDVEFPDNVEAYIVTATEPGITGEKIDEAPEGTPVILHATDGIGVYALTVPETTPSALTTNKLKYSYSSFTITDDNYKKIYVLTVVGDKAGFGPLKKGNTLAAGKAYIEYATAQARDFFAFDSETTGIAKVAVEATDNIDANAPMYNLAGQRVNKSYKGVVIVNGKKMLNK